MLSFEKLYSMGHEEVVFYADKTCGLKAIVAIHNTTLGPALGGTRMWNYESEEDAINDVLRLSKGMTYKAAVSGLHLGGGKAVIIGDPATQKSEALFRSYGRFLETLNGRYITAEDVSITVEDIEHMFTETQYVVGVDKTRGGSGNPAPYTALGVLRGMEASCLKEYGNRSLKGKTVAIQGVGSVGLHLGKLLIDSGAHIIFTDINQSNIERFQREVPSANYISLDEIYSVKCDIYAPCAFGSVINDQTVEQLRCRIVAGSANNQLAESRHGDLLKKRGILYAPDYLINAGGLMNVSIEFEGWNEDKAINMVDKIYKTTLEIFKLADKENLPIHKACDRLAEKRIQSIKDIKHNHLGNTRPELVGRRRGNF